MVHNLRNVLIVLLVNALNGYGQATPKSNDSTYAVSGIKKRMQSFVDRKSGDIFAPIEEWECINGTYFDLNKVNTPSVIFLGFESCPPCRFNLPIVANLLSEKKYRAYNFVYITFDDSATIAHEFIHEQIADHKNIKAVSMSKDYLNANNMAFGYPTVYFLNSDKTISDTEIGGTIENVKDARKRWRSKLDALK